MISSFSFISLKEAIFSRSACSFASFSSCSFSILVERVNKTTLGSFLSLLMDLICALNSEPSL